LKRKFLKLLRIVKDIWQSQNNSGTAKKGYMVSRPRVARIMRRANLRSIVKKKFKVTTDSSHKFSVPENLLDRNFKPGVLGVL